MSDDGDEEALKEAVAWLRGERSMINVIHSDANTNGPWIVQTAQANAAMTEQAYWIVRAHAEGIVAMLKEQTNE